MNGSQLVQKLWNYCNVLLQAGLHYSDYTEQLTFLLFLKMADEQSRPPFNKKSAIPDEYSWSALLKCDGDELDAQYRHTLEELGKKLGMLGIVFQESTEQNPRSRAFTSPDC